MLGWYYFQKESLPVEKPKLESKIWKPKFPWPSLVFLAMKVPWHKLIAVHSKHQHQTTRWPIPKRDLELVCFCFRVNYGRTWPYFNFFDIISHRYTVYTAYSMWCMTNSVSYITDNIRYMYMHAVLKAYFRHWKWWCIFSAFSMSGKICLYCIVLHIS